MPESDFTIRPTTPDDAPALNELYRRLTGIERTIEQWRWEWLDCPSGPAPSWVIVERSSNRVFGHHGVVPVPLLFGRRKLNAARTENTMIDPDVRHRIVYPPIEARLLSELLQRFDPILTTSGKAAHGLIRKRLGYRSVGRWRTFVVGLTPSYVAARFGGQSAGKAMSWLGAAVIRRPAGWSIERTPDLTKIASLLEGSCDPSVIAPDRTTEYLRWRIEGHPYSQISSGLLQRNGRAAAFVAWRFSHGTNGTREIFIDDICTLPNDVDTITPALRALAWLHRSEPVRIILRTLDNDRPLAQAARRIEASYRRNNVADGAELLVRSNLGAADLPWDTTMVLTEGI